MFTEFTDAKGRTRWADPAAVPTDAAPPPTPTTKPTTKKAGKKATATTPPDPGEEVTADGDVSPTDDLRPTSP